jgi:hypothetical protein
LPLTLCAARVRPSALKKSTMDAAPLWLRQTNGVNFRAQLVRSPRNDGQFILWIVESATEAYTVSFVRVIAADVYAADAAAPDVHTAVLLLESDQADDDDEDEAADDGVSTVEIGSFDRETALRFLSWLQESITSARRSSSRR